MSKTVYSALLVLAGGMGFSAAMQQSAWEAPPEARATENPVERTSEAVAEGSELYKKNCLMCHGENGKGDGPATKFIKPAPADISTAEVQERLTDGEIFWKITEGKNPMPPFGRKLSEDERWKIVHYVRTLAES